GALLCLHRHTIYRVQGVVLHAMWTYGTAWGSWDPDTWLAAAGTEGISCRAAVLAIGIHFGGLTGADALTIERLEATTLARRLFGSEAIDREVERARACVSAAGRVRSSLQLLGRVDDGDQQAAGPRRSGRARSDR